MKNIFLILLMISSSAFAGKAKFGLITGLNIASFTNSEDTDSALGIDLGGAMLIKLNPTMSFLSELTYTRYSTKSEETDNSIIPITAKLRANLDYIEVKPKLLFHVSDLLSFSSGINIGIPVSAKVKTEAEVAGQSLTETEDIPNQSLRVGANIGINFHIKAGNTLMIPRIEYDLGFTEAVKDADSKASALKVSLTTLF